MNLFPKAPLAMALLTAATGTIPPFDIPAHAADHADATRGIPDTIRFNRDVRPIMSNTCFECHGPDKNAREAKLRLDISDAAIASGAIVPNSPDKSEAIVRVFLPADDDDHMPPKKFRHQLSDREKAILKKWVEQGAGYEDHWAYIPPKRPGVPGAGATWAINPIDHFTAAKLAANGLEHSPGADPATLLRRLSLDLIGLPPTPEELASFKQELVRNPKSAIPNQIDRLLASPHFGERMAVFWLDLARYADTVGYHGDQARDVSPYRDYVIDAFNKNMPYDQFVTEQLAGDLLPNPTIAQRVATAFNRLNQISEEGGIQDAEYIAKTYSERVRTVSNAFLGSTMGCAECHDHKFDPFTMADFYSMEAFFADIHEKGAYTGDGRYNDNPDLSKFPGTKMSKWGPALDVPDLASQAKIDAINKEVAALEAKLKTDTPQLVASFDKWLAELKASAETAKPSDFVLIEDKGETHGYVVPANFVDKKSGQPVNTGNFSRRQADGKLIQHIVDISKKPYTVADGDVLYADVFIDPKQPTTQVMLQFNDGNWEHRAYWGKADIPYGKRTGQSPAHHRAGELPEKGKWVRLEVPAAAVGFKKGTKILQVAYTQPNGTVYWDQAGVRTNNAAFRSLPGDVVKAIQSKQDLNADQRSRAIAHYRSVAPELAAVRNQIATLKSQIGELNKAPRSTLITISAKPREVRILPRGNWMDKSGEVRRPAVPAFLAKNEPAKDKRLTRLDLAKWIVSKDNPLTARTLVNRLWFLCFGEGLSGVLDDLGSQGRPPTHPELLDWLALELVDSGWDVKHILKLIASSATYQQTSDSYPKLDAADPYNHLLARQSPRRLDAEFIRDNALAVSGLLDSSVGGRSVRPYQPAGHYRHLNFPRRTYQPDKGSSQYRRGVYTHWQRTFLHPAMVAFDAPARDECTADRADSNTPLQALTLLNDPSYIETARALAARILTEGKKHPAGGLTWAFETVLARKPLPEENTILGEVMIKAKARFIAKPEAADALLNVGDYPAPAELDKTELAATTAVARVLLNLHETITRY